MKHALRKYISSSGSALFMVVSTMAALIMLVTAMYMSVVSAGEIQYADFFQEQAYVTSTSIGDMVYTHLAKANASDSLVSAIQGLKKGESVSTNGNGYEAFGVLNGADDDALLGAYDVTITYANDINGVKVYDIAVTVEHNGAVETSHTYMRTSPGESEAPPRLKNFFTSTGYIPSDIWLKKANTNSTMFFDNEYVFLSDHKYATSVSTDMVLDFDITTLGSLNIDIGNTPSSAPAPLTWAIGNDLTVGDHNADVQMLGNSDSDPGTVYVGRDLHWDVSTQKEIKQYTNIYVFNNFYLESGQAKVAGDLYIAGNMYLNRNDWAQSISAGSVHLAVGSKIFVNGTEVSKSDVSLSGAVTWDETDIATKKATAKAKLKAEKWPKWSVQTSANKIDMDFTAYAPGVNDGNMQNIKYIDKDGYIAYGFDASGNLKDWKWSGDNSGVIVIDTGNDPNGIRTITIKGPNVKSADGDYFTWFPWAQNGGALITVGKGTLVIKVENGVIYQDMDKRFIGNIGWFIAGGGSVSYKDGYGLQFGGISNAGSAATVTNVNNHDLILSKDYFNTHSNACEYEVKSVTVKSGEGSNAKTSTKVYFTCKNHGGWYDPDPVKDENGKNTTVTEANATNQEIKNYEDGNGDSLCIGRINKTAFNNFLSEAQNNSFTTFFSHYNGLGDYTAADDKYPNVNIYLVSEYEDAKIYFGSSKFSSGIADSAFFGYLYAPYMTFSMEAQGGGNGKARMVGGLIVSDIILGQDIGFLFMQPDMSLSGIAGDDMEFFESYSDKSWRVDYGL